MPEACYAGSHLRGRTISAAFSDDITSHLRGRKSVQRSVPTSQKMVMNLIVSEHPVAMGSGK